MKYSEKYKFDGIKDFEGEYGIMWTSKNKGGPCFICKEHTEWIDIDFEAHICSQECGERLSFDYMLADVSSGMLADAEWIRDKITNCKTLDQNLKKALEGLDSLERKIKSMQEHLPGWITLFQNG